MNLVCRQSEQNRNGAATGSLIMLLITGLLSGCAVGPDHVRPEIGAEVPASYSADRGPGASSRELAGSRWWVDLGGPALNTLVDEALAQNHNLAQAAARVLEGRALLSGSQSARWPSLEIGGTASRSKTAMNMPIGNFNFYSNQYNVAASARYEVDLWGRLSRAEEAALASLLANEQDQRTVVQTLIADVVRTWLEVREQQNLRSLNTETITNYTRNVEVVEDRYSRGLVSSLDVHMVRQSLHAAKAQLPLVQQNLALGRRRLEILVGRYPSGTILADDQQTSRTPVPVEPLPHVPAGLPSELLQRRPDLQAAELRLRAATAHIGQAKAALFPRLSLTGDLGYRSPELGELFKETTSIWSLVGNLVMPLINRGAQKSQVAAAEARAVQAAEAYQATVLGAFLEVETALDAEARQRERVDHLRDSVKQARRSVDLAEDRYRRGLDNLLVTLETQRRLYNAEIQLLASDRQLRTARVNLILALGGPWDTTDREGENR